MKHTFRKKSDNVFFIFSFYENFTVEHLMLNMRVAILPFFYLNDWDEG